MTVVTGTSDQAVKPGKLANDEVTGPWRLRFWAIFIGQAFSQIGSAMTQFVLLWWITDTTGSVAALALAGMFALLPQALLGPLGGTLADRYSRRALMIGADTLSALCVVGLMALFLTDAVQMWHVYTAMFIRSALQAFQVPASTASIAMLVPQHFLARAAGLNQTLQSISVIASAPLGALAISLAPIGWALSIDVITALLAVIPLLFWAIPQTRPSGPRMGMMSELVEGLKFVWHDRGLRHLYFLMTVVVMVMMPSFTLVPLLVKTHFGGGVQEVAILEGVGGFGMVAGGILVSILAPTRQLRWTLVGLSLTCFAIAAAAVMPANMFWLAVVMWGLSGLAFVAGNAPMTALLSSYVPNQIQGRVFALLNTLMGLAAPIGLAFSTPIGEAIGIRGVFIVVGVMAGVVALSGFFSKPLKRLKAKIEVVKS